MRTRQKPPWRVCAGLKKKSRPHTQKPVRKVVCHIVNAAVCGRCLTQLLHHDAVLRHSYVRLKFLCVLLWPCFGCLVMR